MTMHLHPVVIAGAGAAGGEAAVSLRQQGHVGPILLLGDEAHPPYHRPPLSKGFLAGDAGLDTLPIRTAEAYANAGITLRTGVRVVAIDRGAKAVHLSDGGRVDYHKLILATGGRPRLLGLAGPQTPCNLHYLRTIDDIVRLRAQFRPGQRLTILGGGYVGLEAAAVAATAGLVVTVLEAAERVLCRVTAPAVSAFFEEAHRARGVTIRTGVELESLHYQGGAIAGVECRDGSVVATDLMIAGIGQLPNSELAQTAGLDVSNGIDVDEYGRTADPDIFAAGDCANFPSAFLGRRIRLESVPHALEQARSVAATVCGHDKPYDPVPWFWSHQYDLKLQIVGLTQGYDEVVLRRYPEPHSLGAFYLKTGVLIAADVVGHPADFMAARKLVGLRAACAPEHLTDPAYPLKNYLDAPKKAVQTETPCPKSPSSPTTAASTRSTPLAARP
jgi:3-phenylpropionate/trans-cinnamate dioxygenase ferredoxin reductase subunit